MASKLIFRQFAGKNLTKKFADGGPIFWWANLNLTDFSQSLAYGITSKIEGPYKVALYGKKVSID